MKPLFLNPKDRLEDDEEEMIGRFNGSPSEVINITNYSSNEINPESVTNFLSRLTPKSELIGMINSNLPKGGALVRVTQGLIIDLKNHEVDEKDGRRLEDLGDEASYSLIICPKRETEEVVKEIVRKHGLRVESIAKKDILPSLKTNEYAQDATVIVDRGY